MNPEHLSEDIEALRRGRNRVRNKRALTLAGSELPPLLNSQANVGSFCKILIYSGTVRVL